jgi:hypothetical protein
MNPLCASANRLSGNGVCNWRGERSGGVSEVMRAAPRLGLTPLSDQQAWTRTSAAAVKLLDGYSLSSLTIRRFDRAEIFAATAHDEDAPASQIGGLLRTPAKIMAAERAGESARPYLAPHFSQRTSGPRIVSATWLYPWASMRYGK